MLALLREHTRTNSYILSLVNFIKKTDIGLYNLAYKLNHFIFLYIPFPNAKWE